MDRRRIEQWLAEPTQTWRWNEADDASEYDAVEATEDGFRWFRWSHAFREDGVHGEHDVALQSYRSFAEGGPLREVPKGLEVELERIAWRRAGG